MTPSVRTLKGSKTKGFRGSPLLCPRGSNARGFSTPQSPSVKTWLMADTSSVRYTDFRDRQNGSYAKRRMIIMGIRLFSLSKLSFRAIT